MPTPTNKVRPQSSRHHRPNLAKGITYNEDGSLALTPDDYTVPPAAVKVLTERHRLFIEYYLRDFDSTKAALACGYAQDYATQIGRNYLEMPHIRAEIRRRIDEVAMSADEVLMRLSKQARASLADFIRITPEGPVFDFEKAEALGKLDLVKELKTKTKVLQVVDGGKEQTTSRGRGKGKTKSEESSATEEEGTQAVILGTEVDFKLHDAQAALKLLGQARGLFTEKKDVSGTVRFVVEYGTGNDPNENDDPGHGINQRQQIPVQGFNPLDDEDVEEIVITGDAIPLDPRQNDYKDPVVDVTDYDYSDTDTDNE